MKFLKRRGDSDTDKLLAFIFIAIIGVLLIGLASEQPNVVQGSQKIVQTVNIQSTYLINSQTISGTTYYYSYNSNSVLAFGGINNLNLGVDVGSNFSAVIQHSINALTCGNISLAPQIFNMTHGINLYPCVSITGLARTGDFQTQPNSTTISDTDCTRAAITVEVSTLHTSFQVFPSVSGITISANGSCASTQDGIFINEANGAILDFTMSYDSIFALGGNCINAGTTNAHFWIDNVYLEDCHQNGITGKGNIFISNSYIFGNSLYGVSHITGSGFNSFHNFYLNNVQSAIFCANINNQCNSQDDIIQNNGGASFAQFSVATSNNPTANPTVISGDTFTDSRTSSNAVEQINFEATLENANVEGNYFWSAKNVPCFKFLAGSYITGGALANVLITGNQGSCNNIVGNVSGNFLIGGTSASITHFIGAFGMNSTTVIKSQNYFAANTNLYIACGGGTGVVISIIDPLGNIFSTYPAGCPTQSIELPVGYKINFGAFSVAPTVNVLVKNI